jgi:hypothetical protein
MKVLTYSSQRTALGIGCNLVSSNKADNGRLQCAKHIYGVSMLDKRCGVCTASSFAAFTPKIFTVQVNE